MRVEELVPLSLGHVVVVHTRLLQMTQQLSSSFVLGPAPDLPLLEVLLVALLVQWTTLELPNTPRTQR